MANEESMRIVLKPADAEIVRKIMELTGVSTGSDAVGMLLKKCGSRFLNWWDTGCLTSQTQQVTPAASPPVPESDKIPDFSEQISW